MFLSLPDLSRKIERDSVRRVVATQATFEPGKTPGHSCFRLVGLSDYLCHSTLHFGVKILLLIFSVCTSVFKPNKGLRSYKTLRIQPLLLPLRRCLVREASLQQNVLTSQERK